MHRSYSIWWTETSNSKDEEDTKIIADAATTPAQIEQQTQQIKNKILAVEKMQRVFTLLQSVLLFLLLSGWSGHRELEKAEATSELVTDTNDPISISTLGAWLGRDALGVQHNMIGRCIQSFAEVCILPLVYS